MEKNNGEFESGHPDTNTAPTAGLNKSNVGRLGRLSKSVHGDGLGVEIPNQKPDAMIDRVRIQNHGFDISKTWYLEYYELNPSTGKRERRRVTNQLNRITDAQGRMRGFEDLLNQVLTSTYNRVRVNSPDGEIKQLVGEYLMEKSASLERTSIKNMKLALRYFISWLASEGLLKLPVSEIKKAHISSFRVWLCKGSGNRSVNNHVSFVSMFFNWVIGAHEDLLLKNPCKGLKKLPAKSETHVAYTGKQTRRYFEWMEESNPTLLLFCKFVGMGFIRCEEARKLKVGDIDFEKRTITVPARNNKNGNRVVKPLLEVFYKALIESGLQEENPAHYIFGRTGKPGPKPVHYNYFRKQFRRLKVTFSLNRNYTIYGFRHTFVSQMLDNGAKWHEVMKYTGHSTMEAFSKYARSLGIKPAQDLSGFIDIS